MAISIVHRGRAFTVKVGYDERRFATSHRAYRRLRIYRPGPLNAARYIHHRKVRPALRLGYHRTRKVIAALRPTTRRVTRPALSRRADGKRSMP